MTQAMFETMAVLTGVTLVFVTGLAGYWMTLRHRRRLAELQRGDDLRAELEEIRDDVAARFNELSERVDFTERLLSRGHPAPMEREHPTPV